MTDAERAALKEFIETCVDLAVTKAVASIDRESLRGKPGENGKDVDLATVRDMVGEAVALFEVPKDGKDGKDADPVVIEKMVADAVAKIPVPKDGENGKDGADGVDGKDGKDGLSIKGDPGEKGLDGKDGAPGKDGKDVDPLVIKEMVVQAVAAVPPAKDGRDGRDGIHGKDGRDGKDGITVDQLNAGLEEMLAKGLPDAVRLAVDTVLKGVPLMTYKGVYRPEESYVPGNTATFGGSLWHCNVPTKAKPGTNDDWTLAVKKGRDGRDGDAGGKK